jgi:lysozyme family protein
MTTRFLKLIIPWLFKWEGTKYEDDPDDPGGETRYGIDKRSHPDEDIKNLTADRATQIYWDEYWVKHRCDHMNQPMDWVLFNACVNCGWKRASKLLVESQAVPTRFLRAQADFYRRLVAIKPVARKYLKGWLARLNDLAKATGLDIVV